MPDRAMASVRVRPSPGRSSPSTSSAPMPAGARPAACAAAVTLRPVTGASSTAALPAGSGYRYPITTRSVPPASASGARTSASAPGRSEMSRLQSVIFLTETAMGALLRDALYAFAWRASTAVPASLPAAPRRLSHYNRAMARPEAQRASWPMRVTRRTACAAAAAWAVLAGTAGAQTRPLQTEEATTAPHGTLVLEVGADAIQGEPNFLTGRPRDRWAGPVLRLVHSPSDNVEIDLEWTARVGQRDDPVFGSVSDWGDVGLRAKVRFKDA